MSIIQASCIDQTLTLTNTPVIASGGVGEDFVEFSFCPLWDGYFKTAVFYNSRGVSYSVLDTADTCVVPAQALQVPGNLYISVFGIKDGVTRTSEVLPYQIVEGAITSVDAPDPDVYQQITNEMAKIRSEWASHIVIMGNLVEDLGDLESVVDTLTQDVDSLKIVASGAFAKMAEVQLIASEWAEENGVYTQTVVLDDGTAKSLITLLPTPEQIVQLASDGVTSLQVNNNDGIFIAAATGDTPSIDMTIQATIAEVSA